MLETMLDGEPHWFDEWTNTSNKCYGHWVILMKELVDEGLAEIAGNARASGVKCQDGRGRPRTLYRITEYGKEKAHDIIAFGRY